jgi:two-component system phosphate regulon response regulator OmpR
VIGLELGADDYITKPFHLRELAARVKAAIRRGPDGEESNQQTSQKEDALAQSGHDIIEFSGWQLNPAKYEVTRIDGSETAALTTGEFELLHALAKSSNRVLSREQIFDLTRGEDYDSFDRSVDILIGRIRKKLGDDPKTPALIKTVRGVGYMFIGDIKAAS